MNLDWGLSFRYAKNKTNNSNYEASLEKFETEYAYYNGQLMNAEDLPSNDFNSKWRASLNLNTDFPAIRLNWDHRFSWVGGYSYLQAGTDTINCKYAANQSVCGSLYGQDIDATKYEDVNVGTQFLWDWRFTYKQPIKAEQYLELTLDVNNVLNTKAKASSSSSTTYYKMGRNFWLGASYNW